MFAQVVEHDQRVLAAIAEIFGHREPGKRRDPLQSGGARRFRDDDDATLGRGVGLNGVDRPPDARALLTDGDIDADNIAATLVDDRVDGDRGLTYRAVADDQLALPAPERQQRIDDDQAGLNRLDHEIPVDDFRGRALDRLHRRCRDGALAVERPPQRIDDAAEQRRPDGNAHDVADPAHAVAGFDGIGAVQHDAADAIALQNLGKADLALVEAKQFVEPNIRQSGNERDAVADFLDAADLLGFRAELCRTEPLFGAFDPGLRSYARFSCHEPCPREWMRDRRASCCRR